MVSNVNLHPYSVGDRDATVDEDVEECATVTGSLRLSGGLPRRHGRRLQRVDGDFVMRGNEVETTLRAGHRAHSRAFAYQYLVGGWTRPTAISISETNLSAPWN